MKEPIGAWKLNDDDPYLTRLTEAPRDDRVAASGQFELLVDAMQEAATERLEMLMEANGKKSLW